MQIQKISNHNASWTEDALPTLTAFASDLGITTRYIAENGWPRTLEEGVNGSHNCFGNGQIFVAITKKIVDGDLLYVRYRQNFGALELIVFND